MTPPLAVAGAVTSFARPELAGGDILVAGRPSDTTREIVRQLRGAGGRIAGLGLDPVRDGPSRALDADLFDCASVEGAVSELVEETGKLDVLVCCYPDPETYPGDAIFNLLGATAPYLRDARGSIVFAVGRRARAGETGKHMGFAYVLARELGYFGIRVNLVQYEAAGADDSLGESGAPDVANAVVFLASRKSGRISGQVLRLRGDHPY